MMSSATLTGAAAIAAMRLVVRPRSERSRSN